MNRPAPLNRRGFLAVSAATLAASQAAGAENDSLGLGFSLYGMRSEPIPKALRLCKEIGYDCVELPLTAGWPGDSAKWTPQRIKETRRALAELQLRMSAFMENIKISFDPATGAKNVERLKMGFEAANQLSTSKEPPILETILGGRPGDWENVKQRMADRLAVWAKAAEQAKTVIAIKAHVGGAMHLPQHPVELARQVNSPWLKCAYDYSHFQLQKVEFQQSMRTLIPMTIFVHVKDAYGDAKNVQFLLPGEGKIDYVKLLIGLWKLGYRGDVHVEVSGQIHGRPGYDAVAAAKQSYAHLAKAFQVSKIKRG